MIVEVGSDAIQYFLHKELLSQCSDFFMRPLNEQVIEFKRGLIQLPAEDPDDFDHFVRWMYFGDMLEGEDGFVDWLKHARLWVLADKLAIPEMQNMIIDCWIFRLGSCDGNEPVAKDTAELVTYVWQNTTLNSPLRKLILETYACWWSNDSTQVSMGDAFTTLSSEFYLGVLARIGAFQGKKTSKQRFTLKTQSTDFKVGL